MLRFRPARWAAVLLTAFALLTPAFGMTSDDTAESVVVASTPSPNDMIWG